MYIRSSNIHTSSEMLLSDPRFIAAYFYLETHTKGCLSVCLLVMYDDVRNEMDLDDGYITTVVRVLLKTEENSGRNMRRSTSLSRIARSRPVPSIDVESSGKG